MLSITAIAGELAKGTIRIGDRDVEVTALSAATFDAIQEAFPRPRPTRTKKDPEAGSLSQIPDTEDPAYLDELERWYHVVDTLQVLIACGVAAPIDGEAPAPWDNDWPVEKRRKWGQEAVKLARSRMTAAQIREALRQVDSLITTGKALEALVVEVPPDPAADMSQYKLPRSYGYTNGYLFLKICERFGWTPEELRAVLRQPGMLELLREYERVRQQEEARAAGDDVTP